MTEISVENYLIGQHMKQIFALEYTGELFSRSFNLGDDIQTLAVSRLLPTVDGYVSREALDEVEEECIVPMNGFFMNSNHWPPSESVRPVFYAFHMTPQSEKIVCSPEGIEYLKRWQPIGCRDLGTQKALSKHGIETYYSRCITLTLPRREKEPENGKVFISGVNDAMRHVIPESLRKEAIRVDQAKVRLPITDTAIKLTLADELLKQYREQARLVITSKIHCAMPCIAMGIPVVFLYDANKQNDYRVKIIDDLIGINYVHKKGVLAKLKNQSLSKEIDWQPAALDIESLKEEIKQGFKKAFDRISID